MLAAHEARRHQRGLARRRTALVFALAEHRLADFAHVHMRQIVAREIGDGELAEDIVEDRGGVLDRLVALHEARRFKAGEGEGVHIFFQRHAILQAHRNRDGEVVHQRAEGGALLVHVDEDFADAAILVFAGAQIDLVATDHGLLGIALATVGQTLALAGALHLHALDDLLDDALGQMRGLGGGGHGHQRLDAILFLLAIIFDELGVEGLGELGAIAIKRVGLEAEAPGEHVGLLAIIDRGVVGHVDGLGDGARDEGLRRRQHADMALDREITLAGATAGVGAIEDRVMLHLQMGRAFQSHGAADVNVRRLDLRLGEAEEGQQLEAGIIQLLGGHLEGARQEVRAQRPLVEHELDVEGAGEGAFQRFQLLVGEATGPQARVVDARRLAHGGVTHRESLDLGDLVGAIAQHPQGLGHRVVDDLEIAAARELLELHQREVRLDASGVAIHHKTNRARGGDDGDLRIAIAMLLAERQGLIPGALGRFRKPLVLQRGDVEGYGVDGDLLVTLRLAIGGAAMVADDAQHMVGVGLVAGEGSELLRHLG